MTSILCLTIHVQIQKQLIDSSKRDADQLLTMEVVPRDLLKQDSSFTSIGRSSEKGQDNPIVNPIKIMCM
ncbi:hypothetical protein LWI29_024032 [Acer saccharum]|uniref:Uncharacterized protein n=1 Tax=Acer saccharum TaxID=4024 RepID=A0AA39RIG4_ACESA|nr:hypothetical protein LWI29_024032 [Acer saccharum]